jgi:NitT/TauT family transport system substrate-binding protein
MKPLLSALLLLLFLVAANRSALGQTRRELNIVYPAISGINVGLWVAAEANTFEKYGLDVKLIYIPTALQVTRVVLTGDSPIAFAGGAPIVNAAISGADLVIIGGAANVPAFYLMATPDIKSLADLKGKPVGVSRFGSSTDFVMRYMLKKQGFEPEKDVTILQMGGMPELAAALSKRLVAAAALSSPTDVRARNAGARVLVDMAKAGIHFPHTAIFTRRSYLKNNHEVVLSFFKGYAEGIQRMINDKALAKKVIKKYTRDDNDEILEATYQYALDYVVRPPYPTREGIEEVLKQSPNPEAKKASPDSFIDMSIVQALDDQGFFRQLGMRR